MAQLVLGIDLGTSSIGLSLRNPNIDGPLNEQIEFTSVNVFKSGVGKDDKAKEYSFAAERSKNRRARRLYDVRRRRNWATLRLLIKEGYCPLTEEQLNSWCIYDKTRGGYSRQYPLHASEFEQWIRLDFNGDGKPDYTSPYQLRKELIDIEFDFTKQIDRYKLGRALYHISQHRGFKSSKGERANVTDDNENENLSEALKKSETKRSTKLHEFMDAHSLKTVGCAFAVLESKKIRIRASEYEAVRSDYKQEITEIFERQPQLTRDSSFYLHLISEKKGEGSIFYKNPLRSQKGSVGKCTLEAKKTRCPQAHPVFEEFRAWTFLNNIKIRQENSEWLALPLELKKKIYDSLFIGRVKADFKFEEIRKFIEKELEIELFDHGEKSINYKDNFSVSACPVIARLIKLLGNDWRNYSQVGIKQRKSDNSSTYHTVTYTSESIWNYCFNADDSDDVIRFGTEVLNWDESQTKKLIQLWDSMAVGYAMLSRKAMENILLFLHRGLMYTDAVMLAKVPEIIQKYTHQSADIDSLVDIYLDSVKSELIWKKRIYSITNSLIADYKALGEHTGLFAYKDYEYSLQEDDIRQVEKKSQEYFGKKGWNSIPSKEKDAILEDVTIAYQDFFADKNRDYMHMPKLSEVLYKTLSKSYTQIPQEAYQHLYHPSQISEYRPQENKDKFGELRLGSPNLGSIKNPVALRALNILRLKINDLLDEHIIDPENTRIVIETTRRKGDILDDANMRRAISDYQRTREKENDVIKDILSDLPGIGDITETDIDRARYLLEQPTVDESFEESPYEGETQNGTSKSPYLFDKNIKKYKLWLEQDRQCMYTGKVINLSNLFSGQFDLEHTLPRSLSFDSSDANLTICSSYYNRQIKKNQIPTELPNYEKTVTINGVEYTPIKPRLEKWENRVEHLREMVSYWKYQAKRATAKERKDTCISNMYVWKMELDYWQKKLDGFTRTNIPDGFRNSQLIDTGVITRHAISFLKSIFTNVEAQKGSVTADFRKIIGVQSVEERKNRNYHSHHAIDAMMLSLIPVASKRDKMLKLYYQVQEAKKIGASTSYYEEQLKMELKDCNIRLGNVDIIDFVDSRIIVAHNSNNRILMPSIKNVRVRGKKVQITDGHGNMKDMKSCGSSIRGTLHDQSYYGAITQWKTNGSGKILKDENGQPIISSEIRFVKRFAINDKQQFKSWADLEKKAVNKELVAMMKNQFSENTKWTAAVNEGFYMLDKNGNKINRIRHIRCFVTTTNPIRVRKQTYSSVKEYKNYYYSVNGSNVAYSLYQAEDKRIYEVRSLFDIAQLKNNERIQKLESLFPKVQIIQAGTKKKPLILEYKRLFTITPGQMVILKNEELSIQQLSGLDISNRLYVIRRIFDPNQGLLQLQHHLCAMNDIELMKQYPKERYGKKGINGFSEINFEQRLPRLLLSPKKQNFWVEKVDFKIKNGKVVPIR